MTKNKSIQKLKEAGITLIALVVTIIVLLILAGVTLNLVLGQNSVINRSQYASNIWANVTKNEEKMYADAYTKIGQLSGAANEGGSGGDDTTSTTADYLGLKEGDTVYYKDSENNDIECTVLYAKTDKLGNATSYFNTRGVQIIPRNPVVKKELGNGTGETQSDETNFNIAKGVYNDAINILNTAAQTYVVSQPNLAAIAKSSRCVGSIPDNPSAQNTADYNHEEGINDYFSKHDGEFKVGEADATYTESNLENYTVDVEKLENLGIAKYSYVVNGSSYWLASRQVIVDPGDGNPRSKYTAFHVAQYYYKGWTSSDSLCAVYPGGITTSHSRECGLRPCITLKSNIKVTETNSRKYLTIE